MVRTLFWPVRQRRYAALTIITWTLAVACIGAGTFEWHRFDEKRHDNAVLRANAHAAPVSLTASLVGLTGQSGGESGTLRYRTVSATGRYDAGGETYVDDQYEHGEQGFLVLTPLQTAAGTALVARGFVAGTTSGTRPDAVAPPPTGAVRVRGRLYPGQTADDRLGRLGHDEITAFNPAQQATRLGAPVYDAYIALGRRQPGTAGLRVLPEPNLSNPTGGARELQLLSYVVQWYAFAVLALIAPFLFARAEIREAHRRFLGIDPDAGEFDLDRALDEAPARHERALAAGSSGEHAVAIRTSGELARRDPMSSPRWQRAERLADRYGRTLGPRPLGRERTAFDAAPAGGAVERSTGTPAVSRLSASTPHRSPDDVHGAYNDYLWQLALADGDIPDVVMPSRTPDGAEKPSRDPVAPRVIEGSTVDDPDGDDAAPPVA